MITEFLLWVMAGAARLVFSLFPSGPAPDPVLGGVSSGIGRLFAGAAAMGAWIPWGAVGPALAVVAAILATAGVIKLVRIVASFLTLGGGSAA